MLSDLRYAIRSLRAAPAFAAAAVLCLALGIGVDSTIFSVVNAILVRPLPFAEERRLVALYATNAKRGIDDNLTFSADYLDYRRETRAQFSEMGAFQCCDAMSLAADGTAEYARGARITASVLPVLGVAPALGRDFTPDEEHAGRDRVVLLGDRIWRTRFGADRAIVGRTILVNGRAHTVVGVMPVGYRFPETQDLWLPLVTDPGALERGSNRFTVIGRLRDGVDLAMASVAVAAIAQRLAHDFPESHVGWSAGVHSLRDRFIPKDVRVAMLLFLGAVTFVLLIACANVANLLLVRASARQREIAVRTALGASRARLVRQLLVESIVIALAGGALGLALALWSLDMVREAIPVEMPYWLHFEIDWPVVLVTLGVSALTGLIFGVVPAISASRVDVLSTLKDGGRGSSRRGGRLRGSLVVAEMALSLVLLVGATLMIRSFVAIQHSRLGFDPERVLTVQLHMSGERYAKTIARASFLQDVLGRVREIPGVTSAAAVSNVALSDDNANSSFSVDGHPRARGEEFQAEFDAVSGDYFGALGVPILAGRTFTTREVMDTAQAAVVVNETAARKFWGGESAIGGRIRWGGASDTTQRWLTVVGVSRDMLDRELGKPTPPHLYVAYPRSAWSRMTLVVRTAGDPASAAPAVRAAVHALDPAIPTFEVYTLNQVIQRNFSLWLPRFYGGMFGAFAVVALALAAVGVYGVISHGVAQRAHEIGVRIALGAARRDVIALVLRGGGRLALFGLAVGLPLAFGVARLLGGFLFGVGSGDPLTFAGVSLFLASVALLATYIPARRASRVDPMVALGRE
jgi:putative ABC transport system permease protein